jgi:hypothetical protein
MKYFPLLAVRRPDTGVGEWVAAMVRGLDALDFLERSRDLAAEAVAAAPVRVKTQPDGASREQPRSFTRTYL